MIYSNILRYIRTVEDVEEMSFTINTLLKSIFKTQEQSFEKTLYSISHKTSQKIRELLSQNKMNMDDRKGINDFLTGLKEQLNKLQAIKITLAFYPSEATLDLIFSWVLKNLGFGVILDIQEDKRLLGGAAINFNGRHKDFSLRKKLDEVFATKKQDITYEKL